MTNFPTALIIGLGAALVLMVWGALSGVPRVTRVFTLASWCPFKSRNVTTTFAGDTWGGPPTNVQSCTAFSPSTRVTCEKLCLHLEPLPPVQAGQADQEENAREPVGQSRP